MKKIYLAIIGIFALVFITGCSGYVGSVEKRALLSNCKLQTGGISYDGPCAALDSFSSEIPFNCEITTSKFTYKGTCTKELVDGFAESVAFEYYDQWLDKCTRYMSFERCAAYRWEGEWG